ncbi:MAG: flagellar basal body-associated FliL family protein [Acidobacteriota bacterium]|jgi:flagellar FliL protein|nr:flagellar basal body-associated FliL family protein [Acidobacteriota bacterium]
MAAGENEQKTDSPVAENSADAGGKKKSNMLLVIIGVLVFLLVVAVGGFIGYTRLPALAAGHAGTAEQEEKPPEHPAVQGILALDPFLVNLADVDEIRFLKATFQLGLAKKPAGEVDKNSVEVASIRDAIISLLTSKSSEQVITPQGKDTLRKEIKERVNTLSPDNKVAEVYIVEFVVQL